MNVLFLVPPETVSLESSVPKALEGGKGYYPKLGLMYVAAWYERATGNRPGFIDCPPEGVGQQELLHRVRELRPDVVAMSIMTFNLLDALETARVLKREMPGLKICLGGPHVNLYPQETLNLPEVDFVVYGEGEKIFTRLMQALEKGEHGAEELKTINGLGFMQDGVAVVNTPESSIKIADAMNDSSAPYAPEVDEFEKCALTPTPASIVKPSLVAESPVNCECKLDRIIEFGDEPGAGAVIFGRLVAIHAKDEFIADDGALDPEKLQTIGRLGRNSYATTADRFDLPRPQLRI